jgi:hypothetical protein
MHMHSRSSKLRVFVKAFPTVPGLDFRNCRAVPERSWIEDEVIIQASEYAPEVAEHNSQPRRSLPWLVYGGLDCTRIKWTRGDTRAGGSIQHELSQGAAKWTYPRFALQYALQFSEADTSLSNLLKYRIELRLSTVVFEVDYYVYCVMNRHGALYFLFAAGIFGP